LILACLKNILKKLFSLPIKEGFITYSLDTMLYVLGRSGKYGYIWDVSID
jgi:hypothetical protein